VNAAELPTDERGTPAENARPAEDSRPAEEGLPVGAAEEIRAAVHAEFDAVLPYVVEALRQNNAFDEISDRLRTAEGRIRSRQERPVIIGLHGVLDRIRHLDFDQEVKQALDHDLMRVLGDAGFQETGEAGEGYDPARHHAIEGRAEGGQAVVTKVHSHGLASFGEVVVLAKVEISPDQIPADQA
jgi:molecular chaperone GrpE (heat shock protein)